MSEGRKTGGGSRVGIPNKMSALLKDMILAALDKAGSEAYLVEQAHKNPGPFMTLLGKVLPLAVTGEAGSALIIRWERDKPDKT